MLGSRRSATWLVIVCVGACTEVAGLDDLTFDGSVVGAPGGASATSSSSSMGGNTTVTSCSAADASACGPDEKCSIVDTATGELGCVNAGSHVAFTKCAVDSDCVAGTWCDPASSVCHPTCTSGDACGGGSCFATSVPGWRICSSHCDPTDADACDDANGAVTCHFDGQHANDWDCIVSNETPQGSACSSDADCVAGLLCWSGQNLCGAWCKPVGANCNGFFTCTARSPTMSHDGVEVGVCL